MPSAVALFSPESLLALPFETVFVDRLKPHPQVANSAQGRRHFGEGRLSCHLFSRDAVALHRFATRIGLKRAWFQPHVVAPHYDLTPRKRALAAECGAFEVDLRTYLRALRLARARSNVAEGK